MCAEIVEIMFILEITCKSREVFTWEIICFMLFRQKSRTNMSQTLDKYNFNIEIDIPKIARGTKSRENVSM